jgi:transcriptional regulator with XRE-family HTH domain
MKDRGLAGEIGAAIAVRRKAKGLTQAQVAEMMGVEKETISRIETGVISPTLNRLRQIAEILDCSLSDLFRSDSTAVSDQAESISDMIHSLPEDEREMVVRFVAEVVRVLKSKGARQPE